MACYVFLQRNLLEKQKQDDSLLLEKAKYVCFYFNEALLLLGFVKDFCVYFFRDELAAQIQEESKRLEETR